MNYLKQSIPILLITSTFIFSCEGPVDPNLIETHSTLEIQLLPGQSFTSYFYFWSENPIYGISKEVPDVPWLDLSPESFVSGDCSGNLGVVLYSFTAPVAPGIYEMKTKHSVNEKFNVKVKLHVVDEPTVNITTEMVSLNVGDTLIIPKHIEYLGVELKSCPRYFPSNSQFVSFAIFPNSGLLTVQPELQSVPINTVFTFNRKITSNIPGTYKIYEIIKRQWLGLPYYKLWIVNIN